MSQVDPGLELSLALIVRDEAPRLRRCVESFGDIFDELVIVDTGSVDGTQDVARELLRGRAGRLETFEWIGDFSAARNHACSFCRAPWILMVDGDEALAPGASPRDILDEVRRAPPDVQNLLLIDLTLQDGEVVLAHPVNRLFRNDPAVRWVGKIHETLSVEGRAQRQTSIHLVHDNQQKRPDGGRLPAERSRMYEAGLTEDARREPRNARHFFYLGNTLAERLDAAGAADAFRTYLSLTEGDRLESPDERWHALLNAAWCHRRLGERAEARRLLLAAIALLPLRNESYLSLGDVAFDEGDVEVARHWYQVACGMPQPERSLFLDVQAYRADPWWRLGSALVRKGDLGEALLATERARAWAPRAPEVHERLAQLRTAIESLEAPPTVVIPSRTPALAARCLESLVAAEGETFHEVVVVCDGGVAPFEPLLERFPRARLVDAPRPFVFARSANLGIAAAEGDVVLLNDDATVEPGWLDELRAVARETPDAGPVAPLVTTRGATPSTPAPGARAVPAQAVSFACVYLTRSLLDAVGPLDEGFVWYGWEDNDYCERAAAAGRGAQVAQRARAHHEASRTFGVAARARARAYLDQKRRPTPPACDLLVVVPAGQAARAADALERALPGTRADARVLVVAEVHDDEVGAARLRALDDPRVGVRLEVRPVDGAAVLDDMARLSTAPVVAQARHDADLAPGWLEGLLAALAAPDAGVAYVPGSTSAPGSSGDVAGARAWAVRRSWLEQLGARAGAEPGEPWARLAGRLASRGRAPIGVGGAGRAPGSSASGVDPMIGGAGHPSRVGSGASETPRGPRPGSSPPIDPVPGERPADRPEPG